MGPVFLILRGAYTKGCKNCHLVYTPHMQPIKQLSRDLAGLADKDHYLFSLQDLSAVLPGLGVSAWKALLSRANKSGLLRRVCRGLYLYPNVDYPAGLVLYHAASRLRANKFNYISLETVLSDTGIISQIPMNWIALMSSGRTYTYDCGDFGHIECIHTRKSPSQVELQLHYDDRCRLWRASAGLALQDMVQTRRNMDLVSQEAARELI